jgi:hypothetical protein
VQYEVTKSEVAPYQVQFEVTKSEVAPYPATGSYLNSVASNKINQNYLKSEQADENDSVERFHEEDRFEIFSKGDSCSLVKIEESSQMTPTSVVCKNDVPLNFCH